MDAYFERIGEQEFLPTEYTQGPWDPVYQHFGPPGALLARAIERCADDGDGDDDAVGARDGDARDSDGRDGDARNGDVRDGDARNGDVRDGDVRDGDGDPDDGRRALSLGRISYDILAPVPLRPLTVRIRLERPGRRVRLLHGELLDGARPLVSAAAWAVRPAPDDLPVTGPEHPPPSGPPGPGDTPTKIPRHWACGFLDSVDWHFVRGGYGEPGPAAVWLRPLVPLLAGEPMSPVQRTVLAADSSNGISAELDIRHWGFVPPELTVHLVRPPLGEWLCLDAGTSLGHGRPGLTTSALFDAGGLVARCAQTLLVHRR
jgi:Thioesterase-like superfamily